MLCQQSKLPRGTCKELLKSANLRTYKAFCSWNLDNFGRWSGWFEKPYLWTNGSFEFGFVVCTHSPSLSTGSEIFFDLFGFFQNQRSMQTQVLKINHNNCEGTRLFRTSFSSFSQSNNFYSFYFGDVLHPLSWTETPKILETNNKIPKNIDRLSKWLCQCWVVLWSSYNLCFLVSEWTGKETSVSSW